MDKTVQLMVDNRQIIRNMYEAFAVGDVGSVLAKMDPEIEWNEAENFPYADGNPYIGPLTIAEGVFARLIGEWEDWQLTNLTLYEMNYNKVLGTGRYRAKYKKNDNELDAQFAHLWTLQDGKVVKFQQYTDTKQIHDVISG